METGNPNSPRVCVFNIKISVFGEIMRKNIVKQRKINIRKAMVDSALRYRQEEDAHQREWAERLERDPARNGNSEARHQCLNLTKLVSSVTQRAKGKALVIPE